MLCGHETRSGAYCRNAVGRCPHHVPVEPQEPTPGAPEAAAWSAQRDLRALGWSLLNGLHRGDIDPRRASVMTSIMRVMATFGPEPLAEAEALAETALRGKIMHGLPPSSEAEWARARQAFTPEAVAEFERWQQMLDADRAIGDSKAAQDDFVIHRWEDIDDEHPYDPEIPYE